MAPSGGAPKGPGNDHDPSDVDRWTKLAAQATERARKREDAKRLEKRKEFVAQVRRKISKSPFLLPVIKHALGATNLPEEKGPKAIETTLGKGPTVDPGEISSVAVVGGGLSGLVAAHRLKQSGLDVTVFDQAGVGGQVRSHFEDGHLWESGASHMVETSPVVGELVEELGLEDRVIWSRTGNKMFTIRNKKIHTLPRTPLGLLTTGSLSGMAKLRIVFEPLFWRRRRRKRRRLKPAQPGGGARKDGGGAPAGGAAKPGAPPRVGPPGKQRKQRGGPALVELQIRDGQVVKEERSYKGGRTVSLDLLEDSASEESAAGFIQRHFGSEVTEHYLSAAVSSYGLQPHTMSARWAFPELYEIERAHGSIVMGIVSNWMGLPRAARLMGSAEPSTSGRETSQVVGADSALRGSWGVRTGGRKKWGKRFPHAGRPFSFQGGLQALPDALLSRVGPQNIKQGCQVVALDRDERAIPGQMPKWRVTYTVAPAKPGGPRRRMTKAVDSVLMAAPLNSFKEDSIRLLEGGRPVPLKWMPRVDYSPLAVMVLAFKDTPKKLLKGLGLAVSQAESGSLHANHIAFNSASFRGRAPEGKQGNGVLVTGYFGGERNPAAARKGKAELQALFLQDLKKTIGLDAAPVMARHVPHGRGVPIYRTGYAAVVHAMQMLEAQCPGLFFTGSSLGGLGVGQVIDSGHRVSSRVLNWVETKQAHLAQERRYVEWDSVEAIERAYDEEIADRAMMWRELDVAAERMRKHNTLRRQRAMSAAGPGQGTLKPDGKGGWVNEKGELQKLTDAEKYELRKMVIKEEDKRMSVEVKAQLSAEKEAARQRDLQLREELRQGRAARTKRGKR